MHKSLVASTHMDIYFVNLEYFCTFIYTESLQLLYDWECAVVLYNTKVMLVLMVKMSALQISMASLVFHVMFA